MKQLILSFTGLCFVLSLLAQTYPEPEFSNEVYYLKKDAVFSTMRLEKGSSKMESKTKMGGLGGAESSYTLEGDQSPIHLHAEPLLSFIFSTGVTVKHNSPGADSAMQANGMDPTVMSTGMSSIIDPANMITLYKAESAKGKRKIMMQKTSVALAFGGGKMKSADKYTFSVKKIREGYWELVVDKLLPKGEYVFSVLSLGMGSVNGEAVLFAFAID